MMPLFLSFLKLSWAKIGLSLKSTFTVGIFIVDGFSSFV
jgi:hypothetical protein